jgi:hypothetical protein
MNKVAAYDDDGIWGMGDTEEQAKAKAESTIRDDYEEADKLVAGLKIARIDQEFLAHITGAGKDEGPPYVCELVDGVLVAKADGDGEEDDDDDDDGNGGEEAEPDPATVREPPQDD